MNVYEKCPVVNTRSFTLRLIKEEDAASLYHCYHDQQAVKLMNDDNCDFGFYVESQDKMSETIGYWIDFFKKECFIRFAVVDNVTGKAVGTVEGFKDEIGVLRIDIDTAYEKEEYLKELLEFASTNFHEYFGNDVLVTKAIPEAEQRRQALVEYGWEYIGKYKGYPEYYQKKIM